MRCPRCHAEIEPQFKACPHCGEVITDFLRKYLAEPIDGKYEIVERLGTGGMGEVYKVRHKFLGAMRVIKVIRPQIAGSQDANDRFLREAQLATKVHHQNVATLHDFSALPDGSHYMVWEYIEGENLAQRLRARGTLPPKTAARIIIESLHGLEAIHKAGIVHRDISPENLMLTADGVKIIDLGVAKAEEVDGGTKTGIFVGKLRYASPEQLGFLAEGEKIDGRADLYGLAIVLYEALTGRPPFDAKSPHEYVLMHSRETPAQPIEITMNLPGGAALQQILRKALESDRKKRFQNAAEFAAALEELSKSLPDPEAMKTQVSAFDAESTLRVTGTSHQMPVGDASAAATLFTPVPSSATVRTNVPIAAPAAETVRTPFPAGGEATRAAYTPPAQSSAPAPQGSGSRTAIIAIIAFVVVLAGLGGVFFMTSRNGNEQTVPQSTTQVAATSQPAQSTLDVTTTTAPPATASTATIAPPTATTAATASSTPAPAPAAATPAAPTKSEVAKAQPAPVPEKPKKEAAPSLPLLKYGDASADSSENDAALRQAREQLSGVKAIALRGSDAGLVAELSSLLKKRVTISDDADVTIEFNGTLERLGRGRKRRAATATISKHGQPFFRYELPPEEYRVGDNPAEAFARVLSDVLP